MPTFCHIQTHSHSVSTVLSRQTNVGCTESHYLPLSLSPPSSLQVHTCRTPDYSNKFQIPPFLLLCSCLSSFLSTLQMSRPWVAQSAAPRTRKTKPATACLFSLPHQQCPTHLHALTKTTVIKQAPYIHSPAATSMPHTLADRILTSLPPTLSHTTHTHKHT